MRTQPWKSTRQWSAGEVPKADSSGDFNNDYDVSKLASKPEPGKASIEAFYTTKGNNLFAIRPGGVIGTLTLKDAEGARSVTLLGDPTALKFKNTGKDLSIELPDLPENLRQQPNLDLENKKIALSRASIPAAPRYGERAGVQGSISFIRCRSLAPILRKGPPRAHVTLKRYYRPELDVLRFIAFMIVFIVHRMDFIPIDPAQHYWLYNLCLLGDLGVPVFFLLSAFLITELLFRESDGTGTIQLKAFYMRRILRIWPLYFLVFFGLVLLERFVPYAGAKDPASWLAFTFFAGN